MPDPADFISPPKPARPRVAVSKDGRIGLAGSGAAEAFDAQIRREAQKQFPGPNYLSWLRGFHARLAPKTYLEIGVASGGSLAYAGPETNAVGIDPAFSISHTLAAPTRLFRETSDAFFAARDPVALLGGRLDLAFVDGLHTFDQTFRDIVNVARSCHDGSVVLVHDVAPLHEAVARRDRVTRFWTGDVWKVGLMLRGLLPGVGIWTIPTYPSGLMVLKGLAGQTVDAAALAALQGEVMEKPFPASGAELAEIIGLRPATMEQVLEWLGR